MAPTRITSACAPSRPRRLSAADEDSCAVTPECARYGQLVSLVRGIAGISAALVRRLVPRHTLDRTIPSESAPAAARALRPHPATGPSPSFTTHSLRSVR